jgi:hypothetical protein
MVAAKSLTGNGMDVTMYSTNTSHTESPELLKFKWKLNSSSLLEPLQRYKYTHIYHFSVIAQLLHIHKTSLHEKGTTKREKTQASKLLPDLLGNIYPANNRQSSLQCHSRRTIQVTSLRGVIVSYRVEWTQEQFAPAAANLLAISSNMVQKNKIQAGRSNSSSSVWLQLRRSNMNPSTHCK